MEATVALRIGDELATFVVVIAAFRFVSGDGFTEVVFVDEVVACVVRRVYVPADFDTNRKSLLRRRSAEKGLK